MTKVRSFFLAALSLVPVLAAPQPAWAQLDPGYFVLVQDGREVGRVYVPDDGDACKYREFWYLGADYRFLDARLGNRFDLVPAGKAPVDAEAEARRYLDEHPDGRLMVSVATDLGEGCR